MAQRQTIKNRNALQREADRLAGKLSPIYNKVAGELLAGKSVAVALKEAGYYDDVERIVMDSITFGASVGATGTAYTVASDKFRDWYTSSPSLGGALSDAIRSDATKQAITDVLRQGLKIDNAANSLADTIQRAGTATATNTALPKALQNLLDVARGSGTPAQIKAEAIKAARYVESLSGGPARGSVQLRNAYTRLVESAASGKLKEEYITKALDRKLRYINERIARTEMSKAYEMARYQSYKEDEQITAVRILLSPEHPAPDECDDVADTDVYGLGAGVYPLDDAPELPIHPNCLCMSEPVMMPQSEIDAARVEGALPKDVEVLLDDQRGMPSELLEER